MSRLTHIQAEFVEFIPERLESGRLYISHQFSTASHLCCCGCGLEVVTPLNPAKWYLIEANDTISLHPSVGNWSFPCQSHYWIIEGRVQWALAMSPVQIAAIRQRDQRDAEADVKMTRVFGNTRQRIAKVWLTILDKIRHWLSN